ncbi:hypothetical protein HDU76_009323, partial [Blyttiomyces sp. JEL0837]
MSDCAVAANIFPTLSVDPVNCCNIGNIGCNVDGRITNIYASFAGISGPLSYDIYQLSELNSLYLGGNQINGTLPWSIGYLPKLEYLNLYGNRLSGPLPGSLAQLYQLKNL